MYCVHSSDTAKGESKGREESGSQAVTEGHVKAVHSWDGQVVMEQHPSASLHSKQNQSSDDSAVQADGLWTQVASPRS